MLLASQSRRLSQPPLPPPTPVGAMDALLPELQNTILSRVPAHELVRTSILSRPWRRRWESVPDLDIDLTNIHCWATATTFLSRCAAPIRRLRLHGVPPHLAVCVDSWFRLAAGKSPHVLSIHLPTVGNPPLTSLFACDGAALVELRLGSCSLPAPPVVFAGFRALATLSLEKVFFLALNAWRQVEEMLAAAPGLVELRLRDIVFHVAGDGGLPGRWVIGGQSLRRVELCLEIAGAGFWEIGSVPKLECAHVVLNDSPEHRDYFKLFAALSGVKELNVGNFNGRTYQAPLLTGSLSPTFHNLTILKLDTNFYTLEAYIATWSLLQEVPFLQVLEIMDCFRDGEANVDLVAGCMHTTLRSCFDLFKNLEYLRMIGISCSVNDIYFIKHVVHEATNLKEVSIDMFEGSRKTAQDVSRELKECQRASVASRITIKRGDSVCDV